MYNLYEIYKIEKIFWKYSAEKMIHDLENVGKVIFPIRAHIIEVSHRSW